MSPNFLHVFAHLYFSFNFVRVPSFFFQLSPNLLHIFKHLFFSSYFLSVSLFSEIFWTPLIHTTFYFGEHLIEKKKRKPTKITNCLNDFPKIAQNLMYYSNSHTFCNDPLQNGLFDAKLVLIFKACFSIYLFLDHSSFVKSLTLFFSQYRVLSLHFHNIEFHFDAKMPFEDPYHKQNVFFGKNNIIIFTKVWPNTDCKEQFCISQFKFRILLFLKNIYFLWRLYNSAFAMDKWEMCGYLRNWGKFGLFFGKS